MEWSEHNGHKPFVTGISTYMKMQVVLQDQEKEQIRKSIGGNKMTKVKHNKVVGPDFWWMLQKQCTMIWF